MKRLLPLFAVCTLCGCALSRAGLQPEGEAELWLPDIVSTANAEVRITFSPDGQRMLWGSIGAPHDPQGWQILESFRTAAGWSAPQPASFNSSANDFDPSFAPDGSGVYFFSNREGGFGKDDIYFAPLPSSVNSALPDAWTFGPAVTPSDAGYLYFTSRHAKGKGRADIYRIPYTLKR